MKRSVCLSILLCFGCHLLGMSPAATTPAEKTISAVPGFPGLKKINDNLYVGQAKNGFYLAMERMDGTSSQDDWLMFAKDQFNLIYRTNHPLGVEGTYGFQQVLKHGLGDIWVAYASSTPVTDNFNLERDEKNLEMYMTATTKPNALLTSHMGISRTLANYSQRKEGKVTKYPYQSVDLHSFAAKVLKAENPQRQYMLTVPMPIMREILIKKMPANTVFVGDNIYEKKLTEAHENPLTLMAPRKKSRRESEAEYVQHKKEEAEYQYKMLNIDKKFEQLKKGPTPRIQRIYNEYGHLESLVIKGLNGSPDIHVDDRNYPWLFDEIFKINNNLVAPYVLVDLQALAEAGELKQ